MGAWGPGSFENDDAMDWLGGLTPDSGDAALRPALVAVAEGRGHVEGPDCSVAIAAAEAVAAARGKPATKLPPEVEAWLASSPHIARDLVDVARMAIRRVVSDSELKDLWEESESSEEWREAMSDLESRL